MMAGSAKAGGARHPATPDVPVAAGARSGVTAPAASRAPAPLEAGFTHPGGPAGARSQADLEDDVWQWKLAGASDAVRWQYAKEWREVGISIRRIAVRTGIPYRVMRDVLEACAADADAPADPLGAALADLGLRYEDVPGMESRMTPRFVGRA